MSEKSQWFKPTLSFDGVAIIIAVVALAFHDGRQSQRIDRLETDQIATSSDIKGLSRDVVVASQTCLAAHEAVESLAQRVNSLPHPPIRPPQ